MCIMRINRFYCALIVIAPVLLATLANSARANPYQTGGDLIVVPSVIGIPVPQAAQLLGEAGLRFDSETERPWGQGALVQPNQISLQEPAAGVNVTSGTPVRVTVL